MQHIPTMRTESNVDSKPFRRSQRLQSLLGKMRDSQDDEWGRTPVEGIKSVALSTTKSQETDPRELEEERNDQHAEGKSLDDKITTPIQEVRTKEPDDEYRQAPDTHREPDEVQAREEEIREQIHVAVQDIIIASTGEGKKQSPTSSEFEHPNHRTESLADNLTGGQLATRPKSPLKSISSKKPALSSRSGSLSPKKQSTSDSPHSPIGIPGRRSLAKSRSGKKTFPKKKSLQDDAQDDSSESELSAYQRPVLNTRDSKKPKKSRNTAENKSISSDDSTNASATSSDSSENDTASVASTGTSSDGYSTSSSLKQRDITKNVKATNLAVDTTQISSEPAKVTSPIAEQASDFIKNLVKNLKLHQTFQVPDKIKSHVKSQPIKTAGKERNTSNKPMSDEDENSIVNKGAPQQSPRARPSKGDFKLTTLPRKDVMQELREKLAQRRRAHETSAELASVLEKRFPSKQGHRQKLSSQVLKETESYVETIPRLVSADTESTRSRPLAADENCGAHCGTLLCLGDSSVAPKPLRVVWERGDFLTVREALLALDHSDQLDGVSTIASTRGPTMSVEKLSAALAKRRTTSKTKAPIASHKATTSLQRVPETVEEHSNRKTYKEVYSTVAALSSGGDKQKMDTRQNDDVASLAYSVATEEEREQSIDQSGSDDSSMIPLRHGQREISKPSIARFQIEDQVPVLSSPQPDLTSQRLISARSSSEELVIALSLSDDSNNLIPSPQSQKNGQTLESLNQSVHETKTVTTPADSVPTAAQPSNKALLMQSIQGHQEELFAKIEEFQKRRSQRHLECDDQGDTAAPPSATPRSIHRTPVRADVVELPKASKKVAQAYVDALSKKLEGKNNIPMKALSAPKRKTVVHSIAQPTADAMIHSHSQSYSPISIPKKSGLNARNSNPNPKPQNPDVDVPPSADANAKVNHSKTQKLDSSAAVNVDDLVSRIDSVVHRLIETGKIDPTGSSMEGSDLEQRTLRSNTAELLQNLAILRARRSFGASSRHEQTQSGTSSSSGGGVTVPASFVVTRKPRAGFSSDTRLGPSYDIPTARVERKSIQDLRAKRDQAANAVRLSAQRLSGMSRDISETTNILQEIPRPRSFSSVKVSGPPKPENYTGTIPPSRPLPVPQNLPRESFSTIATISTISRDHRTVVTDDFRGSSHFPITLPDQVTSDMGSWEQEQLQQLPVMLQTTFSGLQGSTGRNTYDFSTQERDIYSTGSEFDTENTSSVGDDETTDYGSDDDSARLLRIESMIHELRARRLRF